MTHRKGNGFVSLISFISVAGIAVGVMALIVVLSVMSGFDRELKSKIVGANPHILVLQNNGVEDIQSVISKIREITQDELVSAAAYVEGQAIVRSESNATGLVVKGLSAEDDTNHSISKYLQQGDLQLLFDINKIGVETEENGEPLGKIAIGYQMARHLRVGVGDRVRIISPYLEEKKSFLPRRAKTEEFEICAIFELGMNTLDSSVALVALPYAQRLFNLEGKASGIAVKIRDVFSAEKVKKDIQRSLGYPYWAQTWIDMNKSFFSALKVEKNVMAILLFLIILVAGFNIVSTLIMVVMEKTKDVGILKALGATRGSITKIFLFQGASVGVFGVGAGAALGLAITFNLNTIANFIERTTGFEIFPSDIYYFSEIPTEVNPHDIMIIVVSALCIAVFAGVYPARRAAKLNPVEALRYE